jgi:hypothetical protein
MKDCQVSPAVASLQSPSDLSLAEASAGDGDAAEGNDLPLPLRE